MKVNKHRMIEKVFIHQGPEDYGGVSEMEGHDQAFQVTKGSVEHSLPFIFFLDPDQSVGISEVQFGKDGRSLEHLKSRTDKEQRVFVVDDDLIVTMKIKTGAKGLIFLGNKEEPYTNGSGWLDDTSS